MLIVLTGKIGSGKSTVAEILVKDFCFKELTFAEPLKQFALSIGFTYEQIYGTQEQKALLINDFWGVSGREFMQTFGTDIMRKQSFYKDFWVKALEVKLKSIPSDENIVISDARFLNEIQMTKKFNSIVVRLDRDTLNFKHESENSLDGYQPDFIIKNNSSLYELKKKVEKLFHNTSVNFALIGPKEFS